MSRPSHFRLCSNCGGVSEAKRDMWGSWVPVRELDNCDHCKAPLTSEDDYNTFSLPEKYKKIMEEKNYEQ